MMRPTTCLLFLTLVGCGPPSMPDPKLTPGVVRDNDPVAICAAGYAAEHRVWHDKHATAEKYGITWVIAKEMEDDDLVPIGLGGDNEDPRNHWLQPCNGWRSIGTNGLRECVSGEAYDKDLKEHADEAKLCSTLRTEGPAIAAQLLYALQRRYLDGDWAR